MNAKQYELVNQVDGYIDWLRRYKKFQPAAINVSMQQYSALLVKENESRSKHNQVPLLKQYRDYKLDVQ